MCDSTSNASSRSEVEHAEVAVRPSCCCKTSGRIHRNASKSACTTFRGWVVHWVRAIRAYRPSCVNRENIEAAILRNRREESLSRINIDIKHGCAPNGIVKGRKL